MDAPRSAIMIIWFSFFEKRDYSYYDNSHVAFPILVAERIKKMGRMDQFRHQNRKNNENDSNRKRIFFLPIISLSCVMLSPCLARGQTTSTHSRNSTSSSEPIIIFFECLFSSSKRISNTLSTLESIFQSFQTTVEESIQSMRKDCAFGWRLFVLLQFVTLPRPSTSFTVPSNHLLVRDLAFSGAADGRQRNHHVPSSLFGISEWRDKDFQLPGTDRLAAVPSLTAGGLPKSICLLPFPYQDVLLQGETKQLRLYEDRFMKLFQDV